MKCIDIVIVGRMLWGENGRCQTGYEARHAKRMNGCIDGGIMDKVHISHMASHVGHDCLSCKYQEDVLPVPGSSIPREVSFVYLVKGLML